VLSPLEQYCHLWVADSFATYAFIWKIDVFRFMINASFNWLTVRLTDWWSILLFCDLGNPEVIECKVFENAVRCCCWFRQRHTGRLWLGCRLISGSPSGLDTVARHGRSVARLSMLLRKSFSTKDTTSPQTSGHSAFLRTSFLLAGEFAYYYVVVYYFLLRRLLLVGLPRPLRPVESLVTRHSYVWASHRQVLNISL